MATVDRLVTPLSRQGQVRWNSISPPRDGCEPPSKTPEKALRPNRDRHPDELFARGHAGRREDKIQNLDERLAAVERRRKAAEEPKRAAADAGKSQ
jgi:hypothetical protein